MLCTGIFAQTAKLDSAFLKNKSCVTIDATLLLKQFFNFNSVGTYYSSPYMLSLDRIIKNNNAIRFDLSFNVNNSKRNSTTQYDSSGDNNSYNNLAVGIGYEKFNTIWKRWTVCYGADLTTSYNYNYDLNRFSTSQYQQTTRIERTYGVLPFLGIIFKLNNRFFIGTETSYNVSYSLKNETLVYASQNNYFNEISKTTGITSYISLPTTINFKIRF